MASPAGGPAPVPDRSEDRKKQESGRLLPLLISKGSQIEGVVLLLRYTATKQLTITHIG